MIALSDRPSACARPYARFDISISSMKEKSTLSEGRISRSLFFGSPSSVRGTGAPFAYASANCLSNAPGLSPALYARYRNQSRSLRVQLNCGVAKDSLADDGATERQSGAAPGSSPAAGTESFRDIVPDMNRLQHTPRVAVEWFEGAMTSRATPLHRWSPCFGRRYPTAKSVRVKIISPR